MNLHANALVKVKTHYDSPREVYVLGRRDDVWFYTITPGHKQVRLAIFSALLFPYDIKTFPTITHKEAGVLARAAQSKHKLTNQRQGES